MNNAVQLSASTEVRLRSYDLESSRSYYFYLESFPCFGRKWSLRMYADVEESVVIKLDNNSKKIIDIIEASFIVIDGRGNANGPFFFSDSVYAPGKQWSIRNLELGSTLLNHLFNLREDLVVKVHMKLVDPSEIPPPFVPENPSACKVIQGMFMDEESADVVFEVGGQKLNCVTRKKAKTSSVTFFAHRLILQRCSSTLAELCRSEEETTPIRITDVSPDIFRHMLYYVYGGTIADDIMNPHAKEIIDVADKYGVVNLKLDAEARLVKATCFRVGNLLDLLLYADSKNCALLKEAAIDFMIKHKVEVINGISFDDAPGALVRDVLAAMAREEKKVGTDEDSRNELSTMRISELRWKAHENGLNVDGSREMLIAALEEASNADS